MKTTFTITLIIALATSYIAFADTFGNGANTFNSDFVTIGNPGNVDDTFVNPVLIPSPIGAVGYAFRMGKFEISRDQVTKASAAGGLGLTLFDMTSFGGNGANRPATGVSWIEAARFVNWLNTSKGIQPAYKFSAQPGDVGYDLVASNLLWQSGDPEFDSSNHFRNRLARYALATADEWHKAAYYDPTANSGAGGYWDFPTGSDTAPTPVANGVGAGSAVYNQPSEQGPADVMQAGGLSAYGVMGMGGNVHELEETESDLTNDNSFNPNRRGVRGGSWVSGLTPNFLGQQFRAETLVGTNFHDRGFRVVELLLAGDYNSNGTVDAADYVRWRENVGTSNVLPNDPTGGTIGQTQYNVWRANFGRTLGTGSAIRETSAIPEPSALVLVVLALCGAGAVSPRRTS